jgi:predicted Zn-dependent protease
VLAAVLAGAVLHFGSAPFRETPDSTPIADASSPPASGTTSAVQPAPPLLKVMPRNATAAEPPTSPESTNPDANTSVSRDEDTAAAETDEAMTQTTVALQGSEQSPREAPASEERRADAAQPDATSPGTRPPDSPGSDSEMVAQRNEGQASADREADDDIVIRRSGNDGEPLAGEDPLESAKRALGRGQRGLAESKLKRLLDDRPDNVEARLLLARLYIENGRPRSAGELLEEGLETGPEDSGIAALYGRLLLEQDRVATARAVLEEHAPAVQSDPDYHLLLAMAHRRAGDQDAAIAAYRRLTKTSPSMGAAWVGLGVSLEAQGDIRGARTAYQRATGGDDRRAAAFARQRLAVMPAPPKAEEQ